MFWQTNNCMIKVKYLCILIHYDNVILIFLFLEVLNYVQVLNNFFQVTE